MVNKRLLQFAIGLAKGKTQLEAAREAGYKGSDNVLRATAGRLVKHPSVIARMKEVEAATFEAAKAGREEAIRINTAMLRARLSWFVKDGFINLKDIPPEAIDSLDSIAVSDKGVRITLDRGGASDRLAKMLGWNVPEEVNVNATRDEDAKALQIAMMKRVNVDPALRAAFQVVAMEQAKMLADIRKGNTGGGKA
jgi:hypothetical protein